MRFLRERLPGRRAAARLKFRLKTSAGGVAFPPVFRFSGDGGTVLANFTFEEIFGLRLAVSVPHGFGEDALYLADFAAPKSKDLPCDLCTGCGIIPVRWIAKGFPGNVSAAEISPLAPPLWAATVAENTLGDRFLPVRGDLRERLFPAGSFTLVTANPPYFDAYAGSGCASPERDAARHESACALAELVAEAARLLRFGGRFCVCHRPERMAELLSLMRENGLEPKRLCLLCHPGKEKPWLLLAEGKKGAKPGLAVEIKTDYDLME